MQDAFWLLFGRLSFLLPWFILCEEALKSNEKPASDVTVCRVIEHG